MIVRILASMAGEGARDDAFGDVRGGGAVW